MNKEDLTKWMEANGVATALQSWASNDLGASQNYEPLEDLATDGSATIKISVKGGKWSITKAETYEGEVTQLEQENKMLKQTVKTQDKTIQTLETEVQKATVKKVAKSKSPEEY